MYKNYMYRNHMYRNHMYRNYMYRNHMCSTLSALSWVSKETNPKPFPLPDIWSLMTTWLTTLPN